MQVHHRLRQPRRPADAARVSMYALGSNGAGQLGCPHNDDINYPQEAGVLYGLYSPTSVIGSGNHTAILQSGYLEPCVIIGYETPKDLPAASSTQRSRKPFVPNVKHCAATWDSFAIARELAPNDPTNKDMVIETFGSSDKGQLGRPTRLSPLPCMDNQNAICIVPPVLCLAAGVQHFVAVLSTGDVIGWGNGRKGQLGTSVDAIADRPVLLQGIGFKAKHAVCGREFTLIIGDPMEGQLVILGSDKFGIKSDAPKVLKGWIDAGAGWGTISVLFFDGRVVSWGRDDHGQRAPPDILPISKIAVGSEHTVALSRTGQVLTWGWGEHGNCGQDVDKDGDVKGRWNVIPVPQDKKSDEGRCVEGVGAGHATSWFWLSKPSSDDQTST